MPPSAPAQEELRQLPQKPARLVWSGQKDASQMEQLLNPPVRTEEVKTILWMIKRLLYEPVLIGDRLFHAVTQV